MDKEHVHLKPSIHNQVMIVYITETQTHSTNKEFWVTSMIFVINSVLSIYKYLLNTPYNVVPV